jgi:hypothetical protein
VWLWIFWLYVLVVIMYSPSKLLHITIKQSPPPTITIGIFFFLIVEGFDVTQNITIDKRSVTWIINPQNKQSNKIFRFILCS